MRGVVAGTPAAIGRGMTKLEMLRYAAATALRARDAIDNCATPEWRAAHHLARKACEAAQAETLRLARDPATRYSDWRTTVDRELMTLGYL